MILFDSRASTVRLASLDKNGAAVCRTEAPNGKCFLHELLGRDHYGHAQIKLHRLYPSNRE